MFDWSSLILFSGIANAFFCIIILFLNQNKFKIKYIISITLILLCIILILGERIIRFSNLESYLPELLFITSPLFFLILPLIYIIQRQLTGLPKFWYLHFIIPLMMTILLIPTITMGNEEKLSMYHLEDIKDPVVIIIFYIIYALFYSGLILRTNQNFKRQILNEVGNNEIEAELLTNRLIFIASTFIVFIPISFLPQYFNLETDLISKLLFIGFSLIPHFFLLAIVSRHQRQFHIAKKSNKPNEPIRDESISENHKEELMNYMKEKQPYLNQNLSLPELSDSIGWSRSFLSNLINSSFDKNFYDFVNEFRLKHAINRIEQGEYKEHTLEFIATNSGFRNYVSFYRIFKRYKKESPTEYIKRLKK